jgi:hypothetical protein
MLGVVPKHTATPAGATPDPASSPSSAPRPPRGGSPAGRLALAVAIAVIVGVFAVQLGSGELGQSAGSGPVAQPSFTAALTTALAGATVTPTRTPSAATPTPSPTPMPSPTPAPTTHRTTTTHPPVKTTTKRPPTTKPPTTTPPSSLVWATTPGPVLGTAGSVRHFRIAVDTATGVSLTDFSNEVDATLGDPRSWIASGSLRLQRVAQTASYNFTIYLASPSRAYSLCIAGGIDIRVGGKPYTSCRVGNNVVINSDRYLHGVPNYGAPLSAYRQYVINHEVGHWLGYNHQLCPGAGRLAPVMQQQTLGLQGCVANSWPYVNGRLYTGPPA